MKVTVRSIKSGAIKAAFVIAAVLIGFAIVTNLDLVAPVSAGVIGA